MQDLIGKRVVINGINGVVTVDHQDGTYTVNLDNHTVYFAVLEEIETKQETKTEAKKPTKLHKIYDTVKNCNEVLVKVRNEIKRCFILGNNDRNYFCVQDVRTGKVYSNIHIRNIAPTESFCFQSRYYQNEVLNQIQEYL